MHVDTVRITTSHQAPTILRTNTFWLPPCRLTTIYQLLGLTKPNQSPPELDPLLFG